MAHFGTIILGAGAAGMMAAAHAGASVLVVDHARAPGEKIRISGGGRCNFTNRHVTPAAFLSENPHFAKSALACYTPHDFIALVERHAIAYHEKTLGQLFCDHSAKAIIDLLLDEMARAGAALWLATAIRAIEKTVSGFLLVLEKDGRHQNVTCDHLVVATGGRSIPKIGATGLAYQIAEQFHHKVTELRPALVPLTFAESLLETTRPLAGIGVPASVSCGRARFDEALLFTHRGLSGPAILQISSYWREKTPIIVNLAPTYDAFAYLREQRSINGRRALTAVLAERMPKNLAQWLVKGSGLGGNLADQPDLMLRRLSDRINAHAITPIGSEGYRSAEVTLGGVATDGLFSKTMESKTVAGLYFIGEAVDVTGWLGGYNFQWAWSSGFAAGRAIRDRMRSN